MSSLFIGLGGVGSGTLDHLYDKMKAYNDDMRRRGNPEVNAYYYYVDTENARYAESPLEFQDGFKTFCQIGMSSPESIKAGLKNERNSSDESKERFELFNKWYKAPVKTTSMTKGADTIRQYSRLAFMKESTQIYNDLNSRIPIVANSQGRIYVITGSCGGTGCGIYMDILYMISQIYENIATENYSTDVRLIMAMPEGYVSDGNTMDVQYMKKKLNAFATLMELNAVCKDKDSYPSLFNNCYVGLHKKTGPFQPFRFGYMYDSAGFKSRDEVSQKVADFLFELELAGDPVAGASEQEGYNGSYFDGLLTGTVDGNWNASVNNDYVNAFNALGQYSIEKPDYLYRQYFSDRLLYDVFHEGLIGKHDAVDTGKVSDIAADFRDECDAQVSNICDTIKATIISKDNFDSDTKAKITFTVFTTPNNDDETVKKIIEKKSVLLQTIREKVYGHCKKWLEEYDFTTVYSILETIDIIAYQAATSTHENFDEQLGKAIKASNSTNIFGKESINPEKALTQFNQLLNTWLTYEMNKALSSGIDVDITIQNNGYLDHCKVFVEKAKRNFTLEKEQEHWDETFKKEVTELKAKEDRCYIPDLITLVDAKGDIVPNSDMVLKYENDVKMTDVSRADFTQGRCTPVTLHKIIIGEMKSSLSLSQEGIDMDTLFDPTPGKTNTLSDASKAKLFVEKYVKTAKEQINNLLAANQSYRELFANDILTRLQQLPETEKGKKCQRFKDYDKVQLRTVDMSGGGGVTQYTYYLLGTGANASLMTLLGISKGQNSDFKADSFFADKIVKLIVKNGYGIDKYRYFAGYKENAEKKMTATQPHDPFIDKRFKGEIVDGKYPCNVSDVLNQINEDTQAAQQAQQFSLDGFDDVEIYKYGLALLYEYFETLKNKGGQINDDLKDAITLLAGTTTIKISQPTYNKLRRKYSLGTARQIDLSSLSSINNMEDLTNWIGIIQSKKDFIENEAELYSKALEDFNLTLSSDLEEAIGNMVGEGNKPDYDFFNAYLDWYKKD